MAWQYAGDSGEWTKDGNLLCIPGHVTLTGLSGSNEMVAGTYELAAGTNVGSGTHLHPYLPPLTPTYLNLETVG